MSLTDFQYKDLIHRCFRCGYCKFPDNWMDVNNCPPYARFRVESYSCGGRLWLTWSSPRFTGATSPKRGWTERFERSLTLITVSGFRNAGEQGRMLPPTVPNGTCMDRTCFRNIIFAMEVMAGSVTTMYPTHT
jgi:hypothetical protein